MNKFWKTKWLEALRSEEYVQTSGTLKRKGNQYCCLGVLCDIYGKKNNGKWTDGGIPSFILNDKSSSGLINSKLANRVGLNHTIQNKLAHLNDSGKSFSEIADYIEQEL